MSFPLSVLDVTPVISGASSAQALRNTIDLARFVDARGYTRFWLAEHHNSPGIASTTPDIMIARVARETRHLRVGSGGVMLPNHAPLVIAEQFGMLEALHPGRIDLGIGRAPGTDPLTAAALRRSMGGLREPDLPQLLGELLGFFNGTFPEDHPYRRITAVPGLGYQPAIWLLGSSDYSARLAGMLGLPFSFAHHFSAANTMPAVQIYRESFQPSEVLDEPYLMLGVAVTCAETAERAEWLSKPAEVAFLRLRQGRPGPYPTPESVEDYVFTPAERNAIEAWNASRIVGDPDHVVAELAALAARTGAQEQMVTTLVHGHDDRLASYRLLAEAAGLPSAAVAPAD